MSSQTVWLPTALYTALIRWQMDDFTAIGFVNAIFGDKAESQIGQRRYRYTFIYRHLIKLVNKGLLKRKHVDDGKRCSHFIRTPKFDEVHFKEEFIGPCALVTESGKERKSETYESVLEGLIARAQHLHIPVENEHLFRFKMNADSGLRVHRFRTPQCTYSDVR